MTSPGANLPPDAGECIWTYAHMTPYGVQLHNPRTYQEATRRRECDIGDGNMVGAVQRAGEPVQAVAREIPVGRRPMVRLMDGAEVDALAYARSLSGLGDPERVVVQLAQRVAALETDMESRQTETSTELASLKDGHNEEIAEFQDRLARVSARLDESRRTIRLLSGRRTTLPVAHGVSRKVRRRVRIRD